jgi:hypothetical protein
LANDLGGLGDYFSLNLYKRGRRWRDKDLAAQAIKDKFSKSVPQSIGITPCDRSPISKFGAKCPADLICNAVSQFGIFS